MYFAISLLLSIGKGCGPTFQQIWILATQRCFVPSLVEIGTVVLEKKIFTVRQCSFRYFIIISLWKREWSPIWANLILPRRTAQGCFVRSLVEIDSVVFEKKMKMWKVYRQTYRRTDDRQQTIRKDHLSFQVRWAKTELLLLYMVKSCHKKKGSTSTEWFSRVSVDKCYLYI